MMLVMLHTSMLYKRVGTTNKAAVISQDSEFQIGCLLHIQAFCPALYLVCSIYCILCLHNSQ